MEEEKRSSTLIKVRLATLVEGDATLIPGLLHFYPWSIPYNVEC